MSYTATVVDSIVIFDARKKKVSLSYTKLTLAITRAGRSKIECPVNQVLWAEVTENRKFGLTLLLRRKTGLTLQKMMGTIDQSLYEAALSWTQSLMNAAYEHRQRNCRFKVIINPYGGPGKAISIFEKKVKPIFEAANCILDVMVTKYHKHCYEYAKAMSLDYEAIVLLSGDGLVHEVFNAFAERDDAIDAFEMPVVQIPTGSASGLSLCLLGLKDGHDVCAATLNAIKGRRMKMDLCSIQQEDKQIISFMSQAVGLMADVDLGTENLRWMGDSRFLVGFIREVGSNRPCPVKLEIQIATEDKKTMVQTYRASRSFGHLPLSGEEHRSEHIKQLRSAQSNGDLYNHERNQPHLEYSENKEGWSTIDAPLVYIYAGKLPYVSRDLMQFPVALSDDGFIDIVAQEHCSRTTLLKNISGAAEGKMYWNPTQRYFKAKGYRITPLAKDGNVSFDGEKYPFAQFQAEIYPQKGTTYGDGSWQTNFSGT